MCVKIESKKTHTCVHSKAHPKKEADKAKPSNDTKIMRGKCDLLLCPNACHHTYTANSEYIANQNEINQKIHQYQQGEGGGGRRMNMGMGSKVKHVRRTAGM